MPSNNARLNEIAAMNAGKSANAIVLEDTIRHASMLERFKITVANDATAALRRDVLPALLQEIEVEAELVLSAKRLPTRLLRLKEAADRLQKSIDLGVAPITKSLTKTLTQLASQEAVLLQTSMQRAVPRVLQMSFNAPSRAVLEQLVKDQPFHGGTLGEWMNGFSKKMGSVTKQELTKGIVQGETTQQIVDRMKEQLPRQSERNLQTIARTATNHVSSAAREETIRSNDDVVKSVQYVATLDGRTTHRCASLDGKVFAFNDGPRPPQHFNCRSTIVPIMKSWAELGIPLKDIDESTRASMNGQVPASMNYNEWLKKQPVAIQNEALGATRAKLFREGKIDIGSLVSQDGRSLSLAEIAKREGLTKADLKLK